MPNGCFWSAWLHRELEARGLPMVLLETHPAARMLESQHNKTDRNDARGLAQARRGRGRAQARGDHALQVDRRLAVPV